MVPKISRRNGLTFLAALLAVFVAVLISFSAFFSLDAVTAPKNSMATAQEVPMSYDPSQLTLPSVFVSHRPTPKPLRAVFMSSWTAGRPVLREKLLERLAGTNINTIVLDVKDSSGKILVKLDAPALAKYDSFNGQVPDIVEFVAELHERGFYVVGHIAVFQDNYLTRRRPDLAIKRLDNNEIWEDDKGLAWLDPSSKEVWDYAIAVAKEAYIVGFDELNFDYIRFPSDGEISKMRFPYYDPVKKTKAQLLEEFFKYLHDNMQEVGAPTSANIFGLVTVNPGDFGIGQVLEKTSPYFDYLCPMVYPSHYPKGWQGYKNPAANPYPVIKLSLDSAVKRLNAQGLPADKLRPWLQDFNLGATYTAYMIKQEQKAVTAAGLDSWMMWDSSNKYTISAYKKS